MENPPRKIQQFKNASGARLLYLAMVRQIMEVLEDRLEQYLDPRSHCTWILKTITGPPRLQNIKRISGSLLKNVMDNLPLKKTRGNAGYEAPLREDWEYYQDLGGKNYLKEVGICLPSNPFFSGILDGILKIDDSWVIVEFKGFIEDQKVQENFGAESTVMTQIIFYSFLLGWKDVILVYGVKDNAQKKINNTLPYGKRDAVIRSVRFNFSETKPHDKELKKMSKNFFLKKFVNEILVWKLMTTENRKLGHKNNKNFEKNFKRQTAPILKAVKAFIRKMKKRKLYMAGSVIYPALENCKIDLGDFEIKF